MESKKIMMPFTLEPEPDIGFDVSDDEDKSPKPRMETMQERLKRLRDEKAFEAKKKENKYYLNALERESIDKQKEIKYLEEIIETKKKKIQYFI